MWRGWGGGLVKQEECSQIFQTVPTSNTRQISDDFHIESFAEDQMNHVDILQSGSFSSIEETV